MKKLNRKDLIQDIEFLRQGFAAAIFQSKMNKDDVALMSFTAYHRNANRIVVELGGESVAPLINNNEVGAYEITNENIAEQLVRNHKDFKSEGFSEYMNGYMNGIVLGLETSQENSPNDLFMNFIRTNHLSSKWEKYLKENDKLIKSKKTIKKTK